MLMYPSSAWEAGQGGRCTAKQPGPVCSSVHWWQGQEPISSKCARTNTECVHVAGYKQMHENVGGISDPAGNRLHLFAKSKGCPGVLPGAGAGPSTLLGATQGAVTVLTASASCPQALLWRLPCGHPFSGCWESRPSGLFHTSRAQCPTVFPSMFNLLI